MSIFKDQTLLKITLDAGQDISTATVWKIDYLKPSGVTGSWTAIAEGTDKISYDVSPGDLDESGKWKIQLHIDMSGIVKGKIVHMEVLDALVA